MKGKGVSANRKVRSRLAGSPVWSRWCRPQGIVEKADPAVVNDPMPILAALTRFAALHDRKRLDRIPASMPMNTVGVADAKV